jgi:hypothetical protein
LRDGDQRAVHRACGSASGSFKEEVMARYVDIEKEIASMQSVLDEHPEDKDAVAYFAFEKIIERLKIAPTADVVEVVRCKDCKYAKPMSFKGYFMCKRHHKYCRKADDFCSYGTKDGEE